MVSMAALSSSSGNAQSLSPADSIFVSGAAPRDDDVFVKQKRLLRSRFAAIALDPSGHLPIIGEDIFQSPTARALPAASLELPEGYLLGPGDVLGVYLLGKSQQEMQLTVAADGRIYLPAAGVVAVAGHTLDEARDLINDSLAKVFSGYHLQLMLIAPKMVSIDVAGEVRRPGRFSLSALNTVLEALSIAGGISPLGSLRHVQLLRSGAVAQTIDLYPFLLQRDRQDDFFLQSGDRIFVPPAVNWIALAGEVMRPGIYELGQRPLSLQEALALAGGSAPLAEITKIELSRLDSTGQRQAQTLDAREPDHFNLRHGDRVRVYSKLQDLQQPTVSIYGEVRQPGAFPFEAGWRVDDLIQKAGGLTRPAYLDEAEIARVEPGQPPQIIKFPLHRLADGDTLANPLVQEDDQIFIRRIPDWDVGPLVELLGEVRFPGKYPIARDRTTLHEVIDRAGGFTSRALLREARVVRSSIRPQLAPQAATLDSPPPEKWTRAEYDDFVMRQDVAELNQVSANFYKLFVLGDHTQDVILQPGDVINVPRTDSLVYVSGRVGLPGGVPFVAGKDVDYYIKKAGDETHDAVRRKAKVIRASGEIVDDEDVAHPEPGDAIWVPRKSDQSRWDTFRDLITVLAQLATIYVVIDRATQ
jgi:protein involved in polysaccharide export with SLBB domain